MFRQDTFFNGLIFGLILPIMFFVIFHEINNMIFGEMVQGFSKQFRAILSVCMNIIPFIIYTKTRKDNAMRGVMAGTFLYAVLIVILIFFINALVG